MNKAKIKTKNKTVPHRTNLPTNPQANLQETKDSNSSNLKQRDSTPEAEELLTEPSTLPLTPELRRIGLQTFQRGCVLGVLQCLVESHVLFGSPLRRNWLISFLRGSVPNTKISPHPHSMASYGLFRTLPKQWIEERVDDLIAASLIDLEGIRKEWKGAVLRSPRLKLSAQGTLVLQQKIPIPEALLKNQKPSHSVNGNTLRKLEIELQSLRRDLSQELEIPAYRILPNTTLAELVFRHPTELEELYEIRGLGENRVQQYGKLLLQTIRKFIERHPLTEGRDPFNWEESKEAKDDNQGLDSSPT